MHRIHVRWQLYALVGLGLLFYQGPSQDSEGNPQDFEISLSDEQKDRVRTLYQNAWQDYEEAKRIKEAALQEELCRRKVRAFRLEVLTESYCLSFV